MDRGAEGRIRFRVGYVENADDLLLLWLSTIIFQQGPGGGLR